MNGEDCIGDIILGLKQRTVELDFKIGTINNELDVTAVPYIFKMHLGKEKL